jgi:site-specific DNA-cytosine methylase
MKAIDLFSCIGCHAIGFERAGIRTIQFCEVDPWRRKKIAAWFPGIPIHEDVRTYDLSGGDIGWPDIIIGGPPCQETSVAAAIHGMRSGASLWPEMFIAGQNARVDWWVVEQPTGNAAWEAEVTRDLRSINRHVARFEFGANDVGAPYLRRRVFLVACTSLPRLEIARQSLPRAIAKTKGAADARGDWDAGQLGALRVDARSACEFDRGEASRERREWIKALGDSNPPHMAEAIGHAIMVAVSDTSQLGKSQ